MPGYTNILQWVGDVNSQKSNENKKITKENYTPQCVVVGGKSFVFNSYEGYTAFIKAINSNSDDEYETHFREALRHELKQ